ncbi:hypothetical protein [Steroidobacter sp.]|uniref:hypothetical protein n=1 Tax=Steroidobacter sp. TaxID=1978227 RepID=UPI001A443075|nr:hypothetical protein [Steroidobacter sp.]MBL8268286.1 hypothetical protein [Steroidobacter sp.]
MKTKVTLLALAWLASGVAFAADKPATPPGPNMDRMALLLDLDAYQKTEVEKILKAQHEQIRTEREAARASGAERPSREEMEAKRTQYRQDLQTKLSGVLNETQLKKFEALHERGPGPGPGRGFGKRDRGGKDSSTTESSKK